MHRILVIDAHDSFIYNLVELLRATRRCRCDVVQPERFDASRLPCYSGLILSPGPGLPQEHPGLMEAFRAAKHTHSILGVCLGLQTMAMACGAALCQLSYPRHGHADTLRIIDLSDPIVGMRSPTDTVGRYHSWVVNGATLPPELSLSAVSRSDGAIMALRHRELPIFGLQFHPESYITSASLEYVSSWLNTCPNASTLPAD